MVKDQGVRNHQIQRTIFALAGGTAALAHAIADHLAATKGNFVAINRVIVLHFNDQFSVGQAYAVTGGRAEKVGVGAPGNS